MNRDIIRVQGISCRGFHGVHAWERSQGQLFTVDVTLTVDTEQAGRSDDLADTVNYSVLAREVAAIVSGQACHLLEQLAQRIAVTVLQSPLVEEATITVHKPEADCGVNAADVSVTITRDRAWLATLPAGENGAGNTPVGEDTREPSPTDAPHPHQVDTPALGIPSVPEDDHNRTVVADESTVFDATYVIALGANIGDPVGQMRAAVEAFVDHPEITVQDVSPLVRTPAQLAPNQDPQPDYSNAIVTVTTGLSVGAFFDFTQELERSAGRRMGEHWQPRPLDIDIVAIGDHHFHSDRLTIPHPRAASRIFVLGPWAMIDQDAELPGVGEVAGLADALPERDDIISFDPDWLTEDEATVTHPSFDSAVLTSPVPEPAAPRVPQRRSIRERLVNSDPVIEEPSPERGSSRTGDNHAESEPAADQRVARTTTTLRRVVVRPTTTGALSILPAQLPEPSEHSESDPNRADGGGDSQ